MFRYSPSVFLANDDQVDVERGLSGEGRYDARVQHRGAKAYVLIEVPADGQEQAVQRDVVLDVGMADGPEEDRVERRECLERRLGHHLSVLPEVARSPRKLRERPCDPVSRSERVQHFQTFVDDVDTNAVTLDDGDLEFGHVSSLVEAVFLSL